VVKAEVRIMYCGVLAISWHSLGDFGNFLAIELCEFNTEGGNG